jgi:hypothetical protein
MHLNRHSSDGGVRISGTQLVSAGDADDEEPDSEIEGRGEGSVGGDSVAAVDGGSEAGRSRYTQNKTALVGLFCILVGLFCILVGLFCMPEGSSRALLHA